MSDPEISQDFVAVMEREALPKLRATQTLQDYLDLLPKPGALDFSMAGRILVDIALGDFAMAREGMIDRLGKAWVPYLDKQSEGLGTRILEQGAALSLADRREIVRLLHEWEAYTVEKIKITHLWERTPFPLEMQIA